LINDESVIVSDAFRAVDRQLWRADRIRGGTRAIPEGTALALTYNGGTYTVMMGTPCDLEEFAIGFSLNADIVETANTTETLDIAEVRQWHRVADVAFHGEGCATERTAPARCRPTGCDLCGIGSIAEALKPLAIVESGPTFSFDQSLTAMRSVTALQKIHDEKHAVHAAASGRRKKGTAA
jgi:FdhD protein